MMERLIALSKSLRRYGFASESDSVLKLAGDDSYIAAATLFEEARNQGIDGMKAVYHVILNRARHTGSSVSDICLSRKQFTCWNNKSPYEIDYNKTTGRDAKAWAAAKSIVNDPGSDITSGSTHYFTGKVPFWAQGPCWIPRITIGDHVFGIDMSVANISALPQDIQNFYPSGQVRRCQPQKESTWPSSVDQQIDKTLQDVEEVLE